LQIHQSGEPVTPGSPGIWRLKSRFVLLSLSEDNPTAETSAYKSSQILGLPKEIIVLDEMVERAASLCQRSEVRRLNLLEDIV